MMMRGRGRRFWQLLAILAASGLAYLAWLWLATPDVARLREGPAPVSSVMRIDAQRSGTAPKRPEYASLSEMTPLLGCAVVKAEDVRFFQHEGFDWPQIWLAVQRLGRRGGASTITQQLARNLFLNQERTIHRKLREAFAARRLEGTLDKRRILELYLNVVPLGPGVWGVRAASAHYFDKGPDELTEFEAAFLASLIAAPNATLAGANLERAVATQRRVLASLHRSGIVSRQGYARATSRLDAVAEALADGAPLAEALSHEAPGSPETDADQGVGLDAPSLDDAFAKACGYDREIAEAYRH